MSDSFKDEANLINRVALKVLPALIIQRKPADTVAQLVAEAYAFAQAMALARE